jgi:hypothetical protein
MVSTPQLEAAGFSSKRHQPATLSSVMNARESEQVSWTPSRAQTFHW